MMKKYNCKNCGKDCSFQYNILNKGYCCNECEKKYDKNYSNLSGKQLFNKLFR